jgi:hypothetical protein
MVRVAFAVFISVATAAGGAMAACPDNQPKTQAQAQAAKKLKPSENCVNLSTVSQISAGVVAAEPAPIVKGPTYTEPTAANYEGPTLGMSKPDPGVRPVPTVGYKWSLE